MISERQTGLVREYRRHAETIRLFHATNTVNVLEYQHAMKQLDAIWWQLYQAGYTPSHLLTLVIIEQENTL